MKKLLFTVLFSILPITSAWACSLNELFSGTAFQLGLTFETRLAVGVDSTNDKKVQIKYHNGSAWRWYNGTDWTNVDGSGTSILAMTATDATNAAGEFYYILSGSALTSIEGNFIHARFYDVANEAVVKTCAYYVQTGTSTVSTAKDRKLNVGTDNRAKAQVEGMDEGVLETIAVLTVNAGNTSTWDIPIDAVDAGVITANGQYKTRTKLLCAKEYREVIDTVQGTPDKIRVHPPFTSAPAGASTCDLKEF